MTGKVFLLDDPFDEKYDIPLRKYNVLYDTNVSWPDINRQVAGAGLYASINYSEESVEGHFFVKAHIPMPECASSKILGVAHSKKELAEKTYQCAKTFAEEIAQRNSWEFADLTSRANQNKLEQLAQSKETTSEEIAFHRNRRICGP